MADELPSAADELKTMYWHSHNADGTRRTEHCCGCWSVVLDDHLYLQCNECGEKRDLTNTVDPDRSAVPLGTPA